MSDAWLAAGLGVAAIAVAVGLRLRERRVRVRSRLMGDPPAVRPGRVDRRRGLSAASLVLAIPVAVLIVTSIVLVIHLHLAVGLAVAFGVLLAIVAHLLLAMAGQRSRLALEQQLADLVDMLAASLSAGLAMLAAIDVAAAQSRLPLRRHVERMAGRIRLGENPIDVFETFRLAVAGDSARLLAFTLSVHWEVGGSIAPALRNVARVTRDRIDLMRRVRSQAAEAQLSVIGILAISYAIGGLMWVSNPDGTRAFFGSRIGGILATVAVVMQSLGLLWMWRLTRIHG